MQTIRFEKAGNPAQVLQISETDIPSLGAEGLLVKVIASPINPSDLMFVRGMYGIQPVLPSGAGFEGVGVVEAAGEDARIPVGSRVSFTGMGSWGQYVVVHQKAVIPLPDAISDEIGAQMFVNPFTAWAMVQESGVQADQWLMVTACGSAYGKLVIQLCKKKGIKTIGTVRRDDLNDDLKKLGLDEVVNTETENLPKRVREITGGQGVRCVLDSVGGQTTEDAMKCLSQGGKILIFGRLSAQNPKLDIGLIIFKEIMIQGFWLTEWMRKVDSATRARVGQEVIGWLASGEVELPVEAIYSLSEIAKAVEHADAPGRWGKILLKM